LGYSDTRFPGSGYFLFKLRNLILQRLGLRLQRFFAGAAAK
jgi:hypothetical protein